MKGTNSSIVFIAVRLLVRPV